MSEQIRTFNEVVEDYFSTLDLYTTAITRAHGSHHPETFEVRELFEKINTKVNEAGTDKPSLEEEFAQLRKITNQYAIPNGVCETYASTYNMLSELDRAYHA